MSPEAAFKFYAITDRKMVPDGNLPGLLEKMAGAGLRGLQLREKDLDGPGLLALAGSIRPALEGHGVKWLVNGPVSAAAAAGSSGVHLPSTADAAAARAALGALALVGKSVHSAAEARAAQAGGADFIVFGPVYDTPSKRQYGAPQGIERLREVCESVGIPVFAVGGMAPEKVSAALKAGARGVAVLSGIMAAENPVEVLKQYGRELGGL